MEMILNFVGSIIETAIVGFIFLLTLIVIR